MSRERGSRPVCHRMQRREGIQHRGDDKIPPAAVQVNGIERTWLRPVAVNQALRRRRAGAPEIRFGGGASGQRQGSGEQVTPRDERTHDGLHVVSIEAYLKHQPQPARVEPTHIGLSQPGKNVVI